MNSGSSVGRHVGIAVLVLYALIFVALSIDIMVRVWALRFSFDSPIDVVVLLYFESVRSLVTVAGLGIVGLAAFRGRQQPALRHFAAAVAFATIAYTKAMGFAAFPGALQESLAVALRERAVPEWLLLTLFAHPQWAVWLVVPPLLLFAAAYPRDVTAVDIMGTGEGEREGAMRGVAVAGSDVGGAARRLTVWLLERRLLAPAPLWSIAVAGAAVHTAVLLNGGPARGVLVNVGAVVFFALAAAACITLLRAGADRAGAAEQLPLVWLQRGSAGTLALFGLAAIAAATSAGVLSTGAFSLAPAAMAGGLFMAVVSAPPALSAPVRSAQADDADLVMVAQRDVDSLQ
jgi:hypothetical protein